MLVVNLFAGSGAGKSTGAAYVFSQLKMMGINCELVTEFAKDKTWEKSTKVFENQAYIFGKQYFKMSRLHNEVDIIVTDSPLLLSIVYNNSPVLTENFNNMVLDVYNFYNNLNFYILRQKEYNPKGRWQDKDEAIKIDEIVKDTLNNYNIEFNYVPGNKDGYDEIVKHIINSLERKTN